MGCKPDIVGVSAENLGDHGEDSTLGAGARREEKPKFLREVKHVLVNITLVAVYFLETYDRGMFGKLDKFRNLFVSFFVISSKKGSAVPGQSCNGGRGGATETNFLKRKSLRRPVWPRAQQPKHPFQGLGT